MLTKLFLYYICKLEVMKKIKINEIQSARSSFWMDRTMFGDWNTAGSIDYTKLASTQRAIGNFVNIVTGKQIPVVFKSADASYTDGSKIVIGTDMSPGSFDSTVGLALHEGSHIAYTDFNILKNFASEVSMQGLDPDLKFGDHEYALIKNLLNWIEDRRIDMLSYKIAPGYRNYYESMYDKYFNSKIVDKALKMGAKRDETWDDYLFHIINFTNPNRDLKALKLLAEIWNMIDLNNIQRLNTTRDSFVLACNIFKKINNHLKLEALKSLHGAQQPATIDGSMSGNGQTASAPDSDSDDSNDAELDAPASNSAPALSAQQQKQLDKAINDQRDFLQGETKLPGRKLSKSQARTVESIKQAGTEVVQIPKRYGSDIDYVETVVIRKLTKNLIDDFRELFNTSASYQEQMQRAILSGIMLGKQLGRKLQIRTENRTLKSSRLETGKIDRRLIAELGYGNTNVFHRVISDTYKNFMIHISIDASGSMQGTKLRNAIKSAVAVAQAASMTTGIRVQITLRGTASNSDRIHTLYAYDSATDKMTKIKSMFRYLSTFGCTPEGGAFKSIEKYIIQDAKSDECIFINYSDGEPSGYVNEPVLYTKRVMESFRNHGLKIIGFFIPDNNGYVYESARHKFKTMYGDDSEFIDSTRLIEIAKSLNTRFLEQKTTA
jgi:hypothetical protein